MCKDNLVVNDCVTAKHGPFTITVDIRHAANSFRLFPWPSWNHFQFLLEGLLTHGREISKTLPDTFDPPNQGRSHKYVNGVALHEV